MSIFCNSKMYINFFFYLSDMKNDLLKEKQLFKTKFSFIFRLRSIHWKKKPFAASGVSLVAGRYFFILLKQLQMTSSVNKEIEKNVLISSRIFLHLFFLIFLMFQVCINRLSKNSTGNKKNPAIYLYKLKKKKSIIF